MIKIKIPIIIPADNAPVRPSSKVETKALGISATIPENIIRDIPFPIPRDVICSPNHIKNVVPATKEIVVKDKQSNPARCAQDATPEKQPAETLEVSRRLENQGTYGVYNWALADQQPNK